MSRQNAVDVSLLRNRLQYEFSELKCITEQELVECKWQVKKKVYSQLFAAAPTLHDHNDHLLDLLDERNKELSVAKNSSKVIDRNIRLEEERDFRTKYLRLVLDGLQKLRWPPSQEAFSDPMDLLFNDPAAVIDSFKFLLDVAIPKSSARFDSHDSILDQQLVESFNHFNSGAAVAKQKVSPKDSRKQSRVLASTPNDPSFELSFSNISAHNDSMDSSYSGDSHNYEYITTQPVDISNRSIASLEPSVDNRNPPLTSRSTRTNMSTASINSTGSARSFYTVNGTRVTKSNAKYEFGMKAFEVLQAQNDALRKKLKILTDSIAARDQQEAKMSAILSELKHTVRDMMEIGTSSSRGANNKRNSVDSIQNDLNQNPYLGLGKNAKSSSGATSAATPGTSGKGATPDDVSTSDEMAVFAEEVQREEQRRLAEKHKALGVHSVLPTDEPAGQHLLICPHCKATIDSGGAAVKSRRSGADTGPANSGGVKAGAAAAAPKAKPLGTFAKSHSANASMLSSSSSATSGGGSMMTSSPPPFKAPTPRQEPAPASDSLTSSSALWSRLQSRLQALESQWSEAVRQSRSHASSGLTHHPLSEQYAPSRSPHSHPTTSPSQLRHNQQHGYISGMSWEEEESVLGLQTPSESVVHQMIGVGRNNNVGSNGSGGSGETHGLDLNRVRLLQRDLVSFAEAAAACVSSLGINEDQQQQESVSETPRTFTRGGSSTSGAGSVGRGGGSSGSNVSVAKSKQRLVELQDSAWLLLLHLSALAPIAPLSSDSPYQSHLTGLEAFTREVFQLIGPKKSHQSKLQSMADRAKAEQVAVIRALTAFKSLTKQWTEYGVSVAPRLDQLGAKYSHCINRTNNDLDRWSTSLNEIVNAFNEAEAARMVMEDLTTGGGGGGGGARRVPQSPLNYLLKGSHGKEIASLLSLLRDHRDELYQIPLQLDMLGERLRSELSGDLDAIKRVSEGYRGAVSRSEGVYETDAGLDENGSGSSGVRSVDKANSSSRNRAEALRQSGSSGSSRTRHSAGGYSTPKSKQQQQLQPPAWNSSTVTNTVGSGSGGGGGGGPPRPPFDTSYL